jgi:hypothetical protein
LDEERERERERSRRMSLTVAAAVHVGVAAAIASLMARRGLKKKSLDASGAAAAFAVGFSSMASGYRFGTAAFNKNE